VTQSVDWWSIAAPLCALAGAVGALVVDAFTPRLSRWLPSVVGLTGLVASAGFVMASYDEPRAAFCLPTTLGRPQDCSWLVADPTLIWWTVVLAATALVLILLTPSYARGELPAGETTFLLLASATGALVVAASGDLVTLVIGMETVSLPAFALVGLRRRDRRGAEAALKYFVASVVATAITLLGVSMVYGATGSLGSGSVATAAGLETAVTPVIGVGMVLTIVGLGFKVAAVPFHAWVPDTYVGAPIPVAAYLSVVSKAAGLVGIVVVLTRFFPVYADTWTVVIGVLAAVTMTVGNLAALRQLHAVRLLAWSSVAQAGYLLVPIAAGASGDGVAALQSYLVMYAVVNLGAFAAVLGAATLGAVRVDDMTGLARTHPWLGIGLAFALLCLAGLPPGVVGLVAKVVIFQAAVDADQLWLAVVLAVNVAIGLVYYLRFVVALFMPVPEGAWEAGEDEPADEMRGIAEGEGGTVATARAVVVRPSDVPWTTEFVVGLTLAASVVLSVFPGPLFFPYG